MPRAVVCRELGPPERLRLEEVASRALREGEARVAIRAAGINFPDILMAAGEYQLTTSLYKQHLAMLKTVLGKSQ